MSEKSVKIDIKIIQNHNEQSRSFLPSITAKSSQVKRRETYAAVAILFYLHDILARRIRNLAS